MAIVKRVNVNRKVVSRRDPSWRFVIERNPDNPKEMLEYFNSLDFEIIKKIGSVKEPFTVFDISPLKVSHECYVDGKNSDWWSIFRSHVTAISETPLTMKGDKIDDSMREEIPFDVVEDIARMIVDLANVDGVSAFFTLPGGYWEFMQNCRRLLAKEQAEKDNATTEDAQPNS